MSKQRNITNHQSDFPVYTAFGIALAQAGFPQTIGEMKYAKITGNKENGYVMVTTPLHTACVYLTGKRENFMKLTHVAFSVLNGSPIKPHKVVSFDIGDMDLMVLMRRFKKLVPGIMYHLIGTKFDFNTAESLLLHIKNPKIRADGANECSVLYSFDNICGVRTIEFQFSWQYGFIEAVVNANRYFICQHFTGKWHEHIASEPIAAADEE